MDTFTYDAANREHARRFATNWLYRDSHWSDDEALADAFVAFLLSLPEDEQDRVCRFGYIHSGAVEAFENQNRGSR